MVLRASRERISTRISQFDSGSGRFAFIENCIAYVFFFKQFSVCIDIPVNYVTKKRECIDRDYRTKGNQIIENLCTIAKE